MMNNINNTIVHCKLAFNGQNRRFSFYGTGFTQLCEQVSQLIGLPVDGFVLKYVDNESDLITVSSNEEFAIALAISEKVLRLRAESISVSAPSSPMEDCADGFHHHKKHHHGHHGHHGHGHHGHHGHHGSYGHGRYHSKGERSSISKCDRKEKKIEILKLFLSQMPPDESLTPAQALRKAHLRQKIQKLESRRAHWSEKKDDENCKRKRKWEKKCKKEHQKDQNLSPEVRQQIHQLKLQVIALRPELCQLRLLKKQKKLELRNCLQTGCGDKESIWQEILDLKVKATQLKSQIQPLKQSVEDLKASSKQQ